MLPLCIQSRQLIITTEEAEGFIVGGSRRAPTVIVLKNTDAIDDLELIK